MHSAIVILFLGINSWLDLKKRQISLWITGVFGLAGLISALYSGQMIWLTVGIGAVFLLLSVATGGAVGMGDGWTLMALGTVLEFWEFLFMLCAGSVLAALWGIFLMAVRKKKRNEEMPFLPFLLMGYMGGICLW